MCCCESEAEQPVIRPRGPAIADMETEELSQSRGGEGHGVGHRRENVVEVMKSRFVDAETGKPVGRWEMWGAGRFWSVEPLAQWGGGWAMVVVVRDRWEEVWAGDLTEGACLSFNTSWAKGPGVISACTPGSCRGSLLAF